LYKTFFTGYSLSSKRKTNRAEEVRLARERQQELLNERAKEAAKERAAREAAERDRKNHCVIGQEKKEE
jgi:hypothetical protein